MRFSLLGFLITFSIVASATAVPARFDAIASQAESARVQERVPDAIRLYQQGTRLRPSWADGWWYLGSLLYDQDRFSEADAVFRHLLTSPTHRGPALAFRGLCQYENRNYDDALAQFRRWANAGWPGTQQLRDVAVFHFALLLTREGKFVESLYLLATLAARVGYNPELGEAMGLASLRVRELPENYAPDRREAIWLAGKAALYASQSPKDFERADEFAARLESLYPTQPEVHYFRGTLFGFEQNGAAAEREYREELNVSPNHVPSLVALAAIDLDKADLAEAGKLARQAAEADPKDAEAHHLRGRIFLAEGDLQASASELETARQLARDNPGVRYHLAAVYKRLGRKQEAKAEYAAFLLLQKKEGVLAPPEVKLGEARENVH